jgi:beta-glucanase (GH16 family)
VFHATSSVRNLAAVIAVVVVASVGIATASASTAGQTIAKTHRVNVSHGLTDAHPATKAHHEARHVAEVHQRSGHVTTHHDTTHHLTRAHHKAHHKAHHPRAHRRTRAHHRAKAHAKKRAVKTSAGQASAFTAQPRRRKRPTTTTTPTTTPATTTPTTTTGTPQPAGVPGNWHLALDSEFTGSSLPADWQTGWFGSGVTGGVNSGEEDCYSPNSITFPGDGAMHINLTATTSTCAGSTKSYTTGLVTTNPDDGRTGPGYQYTYGVLEARVYIPANGTQIANWPAVWTDGQSWPADGEDDVMEGLSGKACFHFHDPLGGPGGCDTTLTPGWHTFASDWQPGSVTYYYDGVDVGSITTGITSAPMYIILGNGVEPGNTVADSMQVQYVRVWQ